MPKLTKSLVESLEPPNTGSRFLWDDQLPGFGLRVLPSGSRRYLVKYRSLGGGRRAPQRWLMLGIHGAITCDQARDLARKALARIASGEDPQADKFAMREAATLHELWSRFEQEQLPLKKLATSRDYQHLWKSVIAPALGNRPVKSLACQDIDRLHKGLRSKPYQANRTLALALRLLNLAEAWGVIAQGSNPARYVEKFKERARERYLTVEEIQRIANALNWLVVKEQISFEAAAAIRLLLLTGARKNEILKARWEWVDQVGQLIALPDSKTGRKTLFLSASALNIVSELKIRQGGGGQGFLLPGRVPDKPLFDLKNPWKLVCQQAGLTGVRIHDLRHTAASIAVNSGASLPVIGRLLGHRQAQTTLRYAHVDRDPALGVANQIDAVIGGVLTATDGKRGEALYTNKKSHLGSLNTETNLLV